MGDAIKKTKDQEKLAKALRDNLKKRKEQQRSRAEYSMEQPKSPLEEKQPSH